MSKEITGMKAVYSYYFPETRKAVGQVDEALKNKRFYLTQTPAAVAQDIIDPLNLRPKLELPARPDGTVDLDALHEPVIDGFVKTHRDVVSGLSDYPNKYPTSGSSEGIFKYLAELRTEGATNIYTLEGEYEGYREYAKTLGINTTEIDPREIDPKKVKPGIWFISTPSARDGNIIQNEVVTDICNAGHEVAIDLAYVGNTKDYKYDITHRNIKVAFFSLSKPYGLFWERIGFTFSREPIQSLIANKWFKDIRGLLVASNVMDKIGPSGLYPQYRAAQEEIVKDIAKDAQVPLQPSDALLLGHVTEDDAKLLDSRQRQLLDMYKRGKGYRVCITPYLEKNEQKQVQVF